MAGKELNTSILCRIMSQTCVPSFKKFELLIDKIREEFKKTEKSDIVQKGRVGWTPKTYFQKERISDMIIGQGWKIN